MKGSGFPLERTMIIAPHPDDDVIAAGGLIQRIVAAGGRLSILYVTDGENNPWPQRAIERKLILRAADRARWGAMRRGEALAALSVLGVPHNMTRFLGFPDHRVASLLLAGDRHLERTLSDAMEELDPTLVIAPSRYDLHPDHRAIAAFSSMALRKSSRAREVRTYVIHGANPNGRVETLLELTSSEQERKEHAILCHRSQLYLSRSRFLSRVRSFETLCRAELDQPERQTRSSFFFASLGHAGSLLARHNPVVPALEPQSGETAILDPAARHA
jgi:N-acetyl-1-D-myo-inositol-2-amino-2-deoxy-alpha-D-glucopyranoside deacetylase